VASHALHVALVDVCVCFVFVLCTLNTLIYSSTNTHSGRRARLALSEERL
jgi:hypothetical protein